MIIRLLPTQIPAFWEPLKLGATQSGEIEVNARPYYFNKLLHSLLNNKSQCFVWLDDKRTLIRIMVTKIIIDKINGDKNLHIETLYSWAMRIDNKEWRSDFLLFKEFADHEGCKYISFETPNPRLFQIGEQVGFKEKSRIFVFNMEA